MSHFQTIISKKIIQPFFFSDKYSGDLNYPNRKHEYIMSMVRRNIEKFRTIFNQRYKVCKSCHSYVLNSQVFDVVTFDVSSSPPTIYLSINEICKSRPAGKIIKIVRGIYGRFPYIASHYQVFKRANSLKSSAHLNVKQL